MPAGDLVVADYQVELRATLTGAGTVYSLGPDGITGLGEPPVKGGDTDLDHADGAYQGRHYTEPRVVTVDYFVKGTPTEAGQRLMNLKTMWKKSEATDLPLHIKLPGVGKMKLVGRPVELVEDTTLLKHGFVRVLATFVCGDPTMFLTPGAPTIGAATSASGSATANWTAPTEVGASPITSYDVYTYLAASNTLFSVNNAGLALTYTKTGLTNDTRYYFRVAALNVNGSGPASTQSSTVAAGVPSPPTIGTATAGVGSGTANWTAPANNGGGITGYAVSTHRVSDNVSIGTDLVGVVFTFNKTGLTAGVACYFRVFAFNANGYSDASPPSNNFTPT